VSGTAKLAAHFIDIRQMAPPVRCNFLGPVIWISVEFGSSFNGIIPELLSIHCTSFTTTA